MILKEKATKNKLRFPGSVGLMVKRDLQQNFTALVADNELMTKHMVIKVLRKHLSCWYGQFLQN